MAITKEIIVNSSTHALLRFHCDTGNANTNVSMADLGGTNGTSVIAIEHIQYSFGPGQPEAGATPVLKPDEVLVQFSDNSSSHLTLYELYGSGEMGGVGRRASSDLDAAGGKVSLRVTFTQYALGTCLILVRKISGF